MHTHTHRVQSVYLPRATTGPLIIFQNSCFFYYTSAKCACISNRNLSYADTQVCIEIMSSQSFRGKSIFGAEDNFISASLLNIDCVSNVPFISNWRFGRHTKFLFDAQ